MATIQQIQKAATQFVYQDIAPAFSFGEQIFITGAAELYIKNAKNILAKYALHPMVSALGVLNTETEEINVDALYQTFAPKFGNEKIPIKIPLIGNIKIGKAELDKFYQYVKEAK